MTNHPNRVHLAYKVYAADQPKPLAAFCFTDAAHVWARNMSMGNNVTYRCTAPDKAKPTLYFRGEIIPNN